MTSPRRIEQDVPALLDDLYLTGTPDYRDDLVRQVARMPQRPAWTFLGRWIPMEIVTTRVPTTRLPMRQLGVLALIAILVASALAVYIGSQQPKLPQPFGLARSGLVAYDKDGDLFVADPRTGNSTAIVTGPEIDSAPRFSRDGRRIVFTRSDGRVRRLFVAAADGTGATAITVDPISLTPSLLGEPWEQYQFSPDGRSVVIASLSDVVPGIAIANADGSRVRRLGLEIAAYEPSFRPPDGQEILFVGVTTGGETGIYAVDPATEKVRTIVEPTPTFGLAGPTWSPDGSRIAYWRWGGANVALNPRTHIVRADGTGDRELPLAPGSLWDAGSEWSNDGTRLIVVRGYNDSFSGVQVAIVPADGSSAGREVAYAGTLNLECCVSFEWSPDDREILATPAGSSGEPLEQVMIDVESATGAPVSWDTRADPTWQRLAP